MEQNKQNKIEDEMQGQRGNKKRNRIIVKNKFEQKIHCAIVVKMLKINQIGIKEN